MISFQPRSSIRWKKSSQAWYTWMISKNTSTEEPQNTPSIIGKMMIQYPWDWMVPYESTKNYTSISASDCLGPAMGPRGGVGDWPTLATLIHGLCKKLECREGPGTANLTKLLCKKVCFFKFTILPMLFVWITTCKCEDFSRLPFFAFFTFSSSTLPSAISRTAISPQKTTKKVISNTSNTSCKQFPNASSISQTEWQQSILPLHGKKDIRCLGLNFSTPMKFANFMTTTRNYRNCIQEVTSLFNPNRVTSSLLACYVFFSAWSWRFHPCLQSCWPRGGGKLSIIIVMTSRLGRKRDATKTKEQQTAVHRSITFLLYWLKFQTVFFRNLRNIHRRRETAGNWPCENFKQTFQANRNFFTISNSTKGHCSRWRAWWHSWTSH